MNPTPVIFISGWAVPAAIAQPCWAAFDGPVTVYDISNADETDAKTSLAADLARLIRAQPRPPLVIGWSAGALLALEVAVQPDIQLVGLVAISGTACFCKRPDYDFGQPSDLVAALQAGVLADNTRQPTLNRFYRECAYPERLRPPWRTQLDQAAAQLNAQQLANVLTHLQATDLRDQLGQITVPMLFIHGRQDAIIPVAAAQWAASRICSARLHILPDAGHLLPLLNHAVITEQVKQFLQEIQS